jgi:mono/diheme cytochrome c family protein
MGLERISHNHLSEGRPAGRAYSAGPFLTVGLLTLSAAARLFLKVSLLNMKLLLKLIFVAGGIFVTVNSLTLNQDARNQTRAISSSAVLVAPTEALYKQKCSKCHGADGSGGTSMGRIFNAPDFSDGGWWAKHPSGELVSVITRGKKNMPAFGKKLTTAQVAGLAAYVQKFKR